MSAIVVQRQLRGALATFLDEELTGLIVEQGLTDAKPTSSFQRVIQRAVHHVQMHLPTH